MKIFELKKIDGLCFGVEDISKALGISVASARVTASRYARQGVLLRMKKNMYVLREAWNAAGREEKFQLANLGQVPSYISLMTALDYFEMTTQMQRNYFESVAVRRSKEIHMNGSLFRYVKLAPNLYDTFEKVKNFFIATPEKALLDAFYLLSCGRYSLDLSSLDAAKFDRGEIQRLSGKFPLKTKTLLERYGYL